MIFTRNPNSTILSHVKCDVKLVARRTLKFDIVGNLTRPLRRAWLHAVAYYRYTNYQKYALDLWEDLCGWLDGKKKSYILDWTVKRVQDYTNVNHPCPIEGHVFVKTDNISLDKFTTEPLLPSGRYRLDVNFTEGKKGNVLLMAKMFVSVSDHRVEIY